MMSPDLGDNIIFLNQILVLYNKTSISEVIYSSAFQDVSVGRNRLYFMIPCICYYLPSPVDLIKCCNEMFIIRVSRKITSLICLIRLKMIL